MQASLESGASALSLLTPQGYQASDCGYCKNDGTSQRRPKSRACYYVTSKTLSVDTYQELIDRGFRRSGTLIYKPDVFRACCPHYTIRLPAASLITSRDQRQTLNRWNRFVLGEQYIKEATKRYPKTKEEKSRQKNEFDLLETVHEAEYCRLKPIEPAHKFEVNLEKATCTDEKFLLYKNYQVHVHHDKPNTVTRSGFERFLCKSPLRLDSVQKDGKSQLLGSYHQCYRLDGRLIAIGVLDLLPHAVSGVYFMYHQDAEKWSFGKLSAIREAALAVEAGYEYYYMGYYIHNCVKMRYKGDYKPQFVLDPESYDWSPLDTELKSLLDSKKYVSLSRERRNGKPSRPLDDTTSGAPDPPLSEIVDLKSATTDPTKVKPELEYDIPDPKDAADGSMSLLTIGMPGVMTADEVQEQVDLDKIVILLRGGKLVETEDLVAWEDGNMLDPHSLKGVVSEYAACVGPEIAKKAMLDFSP